MQAVCPITDKRIDERVARINGLVTFVLVLAFVIFQLWIPFVFLTIDFVVRGLFNNKYSVLCMFSKQISQLMGTQPKMINAGPKIFAAQVGMVLSIASLVLFFMEFSVASLAIAGLLGFFSFLEGAFGYCVACKLYPIFRNIQG